MKFKEYIKLRGARSLTTKEIEILGIDYSSGWYKRYKNVEFDNILILKCSMALKKSSSKFKNSYDKIINEISFKCNDSFDLYDEQNLYLMKNDLGLYKIGISKDPFARARSISNNSGLPTIVIASWLVKDAYKLEQSLHKLFKRYRVMGEWFRFGGIFFNEVDKNIVGKINYKSVII